MSVFTTLVKREFLEHKITMLWVPLIIAALMIVVVGSGLVTGRAHFGPDGKGFEISDKVSGTITLDIDEIAPTPEKRATLASDIAKLGPDSGIVVSDDEVTIDIAKARAHGGLGLVEKATKVNGSIAPVAASTITTPLLLTAMISIYFMLLGCLYEERSDRSILFWKSMPASDAQAVLAKALTIILGTFAIAIVVSFGLSGVVLLMFKLAARDTAIDVMMQGATFGGFVSIWTSVLAAAFMYALWAAPIYAWFLFVSAAAPRAPFLFATLPVVAIIALEKVIGLRTGFSAEVGARLTGYFVSSQSGLKTLFDGAGGGKYERLNEAPAAILSGLAQPGVWIGLAVAAVLVYGAIEMRKRKSL